MRKQLLHAFLCVLKPLMHCYFACFFNFVLRLQKSRVALLNFAQVFVLRAFETSYCALGTSLYLHGGLPTIFFSLLQVRLNVFSKLWCLCNSDYVAHWESFFAPWFPILKLWVNSNFTLCLTSQSLVGLEIGSIRPCKL